MRKIFLLFLLFIITISFALEFNISVTYKLKSLFSPTTIAYPLDLRYLILKGYFSLSKREHIEPKVNLFKFNIILPTFRIDNVLPYKMVKMPNSCKRYFIFPKTHAFVNVSEGFLSLKTTSELHFLRIKHKVFFSISNNPKILTEKIKMISLRNSTSFLSIKRKKFINTEFYENFLTLPIKQIISLSQNFKLINLKTNTIGKSLYSTKNSYLSLSYGDGYNFNFYVSFPLSIDYDGKSFNICSEYGNLTMQSSNIYYSYLLYYKLNDLLNIEAKVDTKNDFYSLAFSHDLNNINFELGIAYTENSVLPEGGIVWKNSFLTFVGTKVSLNFSFSNFSVAIDYNKSLSYYTKFEINNWRFGFGYSKDLKFEISTGFDYYFPFVVTIGFDNTFFIKAQSTYSDIDFGYDSMINRIYVTINKNL